MTEDQLHKSTKMIPLRMATLLFFSSILFYWFQPTIQFLARRRFKEARFVLDVLHQLSVTPFHIYNVSDSLDCTFKCIEHDQCLSFNMVFNSTGRFKVCHLLSTDKYNSSSDWRPSTEFHYHSIVIGLKRGELNPCRNGGTLIPLYWTGDHKCSCPPNTNGNHCEWIKLNSDPVHIESKDDKFGTFKAIKSGQILKFKLVHIAGGMSCWITEPGFEITKLGCGPSLAIFITNTNNDVISPTPPLASLTYGNYRLPGVTSNDSEIILPEINPPLHVTAGQVFRVWYGEDLINSPEGDNVGTLDIDVYAFY